MPGLLFAQSPSTGSSSSDADNSGSDSAAGDGIISVPRLRFPSGGDRIGNSDIVRLHLQWSRKDYRQHKFLNRLYTRKLNSGFRNYFSFSAALTRQGDLARRQRQPDAAVMLYKNAARFSPDLAEPQFRLFFTILMSKPHKFMSYLPPLVKGVRLQLFEFFNALSFVGNVVWFAAVVFLLALFVFWLFTNFGVMPAAYRELEARLPKGTSSLQLLSLLGLILAFPLLMRWGILESVLFWSLTMWGFQRAKARMVSLLVLLSLFFSPELLSLSKKVTAVAPPSLMQLYRLSRDADTSRLVRKIKLQLPAMEKTNKVLAYEFLWALGLYHKRRGELIWARRYYSKALQWQKHPALLVNFGNVEAIAQKGAKARDAYKLAMKKDSSVEEARYNLMRITQNSVTRRKFQNLSVENEFRSRKVFAFLRSSQKQVNRYLMDVDLPDSRFWELYNAWLLKWRDLETHWSQVCSVLPFQARPFFGGAALLLFVLLWLFRRRLFPERKSKLLVLETQELTLEERTSRSLLLEYRERMKFRIHLFLSFFVMGSDKVLDGKLFSGFLRILFVSWVAALWLGQGFVFSHPWSLGGSLLGGKWLLTGITIVFGLLALGNVRRVWNQSGRRSERE